MTLIYDAAMRRYSWLLILLILLKLSWSTAAAMQLSAEQVAEAVSTARSAQAAWAAKPVAEFHVGEAVRRTSRIASVTIP